LLIALATACNGEASNADATSRGGTAPQSSGGAASGGAASGRAASGGASATGSGGHTMDGHGGSDAKLCGGNTTFAGTISCSASAACERLACGKPWSFYDADGGRRSECSEAGTCPKGERCVTAALTGNFEQSCFSDFDGCEQHAGTCVCDQYECYELRLCLPEAEFPAEKECPIADLDCSALARAKLGLEAYSKELALLWAPQAPPPGDPKVDDCKAKIDARLADCR
jgi:hypothetical protein